MSEVEEEIDKLFRECATQEERNELWKVFLEWFREVSDDEEWARLRKRLDEKLAKLSAH
jgi:hypothetical protein